ncbi:MAG: GxxExxY protein, partial [Planctomycetota bacterium]|nr:GxxExxY protein [Planctomycetota bacterium]
MNQNSNPTILFAEECYRIQGAIFEVYRVMGCGFLESVYQECLQHEFQSRGIPFRAKSTLTLHYKEIVLEQTFQPDFVCYDKIIVELKAVREFAPEHSAQVLNYLKATDLRLGLLVNFGSYPKAIVKRL